MNYTPDIGDMNMKKEMISETYNGFEQGPIRPPSEANSLLLRLSRNCPWNKCTFCPVYKGATFSLRPVSHIIEDINIIHKQVEKLQNASGGGSYIPREKMNEILARTDESEMEALHTAINWMRSGMRSVFLQDANSLILKPAELIQVLQHVRKCFPWTDRVTSYARSHTIARIKDDELKEIADAGLNRIHIGLESASDKVLERVKKGATKEMHIRAGIKVKNAGMELSEYVMPGLGGVDLSREHALETADALNQINPDFIRLRSLAIPAHVALYKEYQEGAFKKCSDIMVAEEILLFLETLDGITSTLKSDHVLNLFQDIEGTYPADKEKMTGIVKAFLNLPELERMYCQVGRRLGMIRTAEDLNDMSRLEHIKATCEANGITPETVDVVIEDIMRRFI